jgi:hypothetical protein
VDEKHAPVLSKEIKIPAFVEEKVAPLWMK